MKQNPGNVNSSRPEVLEHLRWLLLDVINILIQNHRLIKRARILTLEKPSSKELYSILVTKFTNKHSSNVYFEKIFPNMKFNWRKIYVLPCITTINTYLLSLQYKILNKILFLNKKLFIFWMKIHHYAISVVKKKGNRCISLVNVPLWFIFSNSSQLF